MIDSPSLRSADPYSLLESASEDRSPERSHMSAVDQLLRLLLEDSRNISARMAAAGYSEDEIRGAWNYARRAGYTEATGLGQDRLTEKGRERARYL